MKLRDKTGDVMGGFRDLSGQDFGRLSVISVGPINRSGNYTWNCMCNCGTATTVAGDHLVRRFQPVKSCGCFRNDRTRQVCSPDPNAVAYRLLVGGYKKRARLNNMEFTLTDEQFRMLTSSDCRYCGAQPEMVMENKPRTGMYVYNSIDRRDPNKGYTFENSSPSCKTCNYMKWVLSDDRFIRQAQLIAEKAKTR